jgi:hypothetical protein
MPKTCSIVAALLVTSCASTHSTSFQDPDFRGKPFRRLVVLSGPAPLTQRASIETRMVYVLRKYEIYAVGGLQVFPPTRTLSPEEMARTLQEGGFDGVLIVSETNSGVQQTYVPPSGPSTSTTTGTITSNGYGAASYSGTTTTYTPQGHTVNRPWADFDARLVDVASGKTAWIANSRTGGNGYATFETVLGSYCESTADDLVSQGVVAKSPPPDMRPRPPTPEPTPDPCAEPASRARKSADAVARAHQYAVQTCQGGQSAACTWAQTAEQQQQGTATEDQASLSRCQSQQR